MRWKLKTKAECKDGTERVIQRYALFPRTLNDEYRVWLERYYVKQRYWIFKRKGEWTDRETWSESTQKRLFLDSIKDSDTNVQDYMDSTTYVKAKQAARRVLRKRNSTY